MASKKVKALNKAIGEFNDLMDAAWHKTVQPVLDDYDFEDVDTPDQPDPLSAVE